MKAHSLLLFLLALPALGATHYISAIGSDSNAGTGKTTSWLHAPGMANCTGNCASYTPVAGDQIIFRGGDTWHFGAATSPSVGSGGWTHSWSGSSGNPIYIGVDLTWFAGGSWVRPILNGDNPLNPMPGVVNSQVASCAHPGSINININANWVTFDNFEFVGHCWNTNTFGANAMITTVSTASPDGILITNNYVHGWTNTAAGQAEGGTWLHPANNHDGTTIEFNVVDGSDSDPATLNYHMGDMTTFAYNVIRYNQGQNSTSGCYRVHDNLFEHMFNVADGSGAHSDVLQCYGETSNGSGDPNLTYNNIWSNIAAMSTSGIWWFPPAGQTDYAFNNVSNNVGSGGPDNFMFNQTGGPGGGNLTLFNNTMALGTSSVIVRNDLGGGGTVTSINNHWIATPATSSEVFATPGSVTESSATYQTDSAATAQGYTAGNNYAPTSGTGATVGAGANRTSFCNGLVDANAKSSCLSGTTNGCTYVTATHSVSCPNIAAIARPSSGAWNTGAYQFSGSGSLLPPTFSPPGASYGPAQTVTISLPAGATGCYTTDGSTPAATTAGTCSHGTTYSTAITVSTSQTVQALATEVGFTNSAVANAVYVINGALATPTIAPPTGTYAGPQSATISGPAGSTLWYNFTGTFTGCTASSCPTATMYTGPVTISTSETIHALATEAGWSNSTVATAAYTINGALPAPTFTPSAGSYGPTQTVTINLPAGATGCYTTDGSTPAATTAGTCSHGTTVSGTVSVSSTLTLKAISTEATFLNSSVSSALYTINGALGTPTFSPNGGSFAGPQTVSITCPAGATCWYNFTGTFTSCTPTVCAGATMYSTPVTVSTTSTLSSIATEAGWSNSSVGSAAFTINGTLSAPTLSPGAGVYPTTQTVTVTLPMSATGCYTIDGTTPTATTPGTCAHGATVSGTISITTTTTLKVLATEVAFTNSTVTTALYTVVPPSPCTISSPTASQLIQTPGPLQLQSSCSTAPTATKAIYYIDYQRVASGYSNPALGSAINDFSTAWCGPFCATWWTGLNGDGPHTIYAKFYQFDTLLATTPVITFTVRLEGMTNQSVSPAVPTSGKSSNWGMLTFDGTANAQASVDGVPIDSNSGGACQSNPGRTSQSGGWLTPNFNTTCWPNGPHLIQSGYAQGLIHDPYLLGVTVGSVSATTITTSAPHYSVNGSIVTFSNSGGALPSPLVAGTQCENNSSATTTCTATLSVSGGVMTIATSVNTGATTSTPVFLRNIRSTNKQGLPNCDGQYTANAGTTGTSILITAPGGCPNGVTTTSVFEVIVNPYCVSGVTSAAPTTLSVATTCGGSPISLTSGSGTTTMTQRIRSPYWGGTFDAASLGGIASIIQMVTFANGTIPMELRPAFWEMHLVSGSGAASLPVTVENTDLTSTTLAPGATGLTFTEVDDGGQSGVCTVNTAAQTVTPVAAGWCKVQVSCSSCAAGSVSLPTVTVYVQVHSGSVTFPHFTSCGVIAQAFNSSLPAGCTSHWMKSAWQTGFLFTTAFNTNVASRAAWLAPALKAANFNTVQYGVTANISLSDPTSTTCPFPLTSTSAAQIYYSEQFAIQNNMNLEFDMQPILWYNGGSDLRPLGAILNNTGFNRKACVQAMGTHFATTGLYNRFYLDDESTNFYGSIFRPNPTIGGGNWISATVASNVITFAINPYLTPLQWSQSAGTGSWVDVVNAMNSCLNGWYPLNTVSLTGYSATLTSTSACGDGVYEPSGGVTETTAQLVINPSPLQSQQNISALPAALSACEQHWTFIADCSGAGIASSSALTSIAIATCVATVNYAGNLIPNGSAIRIWSATTPNLNIVAPVTAGSNSVTFTYPGTTGQACPADGTYNASSDASLYITVDPNWGPDPIGQFYALVNGATNAPVSSYSILGSFFLATSNSPTIKSYENTPNAMSAFLYNGNSSPTPPIYGVDGSVYQWGTLTQSGSGLLTRAYQTRPRSMLWSSDPSFAHYSPSIYFNPATDKPFNLFFWRPEGVVAQRMGYKMLGVSYDRLYNYDNNMSLDFANCCGWSAPGTGLNIGISSYVFPKLGQAAATVNNLLTLREDTELQPEANKPNLGPMFLTDAHTNAAYGNERSVLCKSEVPYGTQTLPLASIAGGSTLLYTTDGYTTRVSLVVGNPSSATGEFCPSPAFTSVYVSQPPGQNVLDQIVFTPPSPIPFSATHMLIQVGYYPYAMQDDPVFDATSGVTIPIDHHSIDAWYRTIYTDANYQPLSVSDATLIPSQGLP